MLQTLDVYVNPRHRKEEGWRPEKPVSPFAPDQPPRESPWRILGEGQELRVLSPKRGASDDRSFDKKTHSLSDIDIYYSKCKEASMGMRYVWSEGLGNQPHTVRSSVLPGSLCGGQDRSPISGLDLHPSLSGHGRGQDAKCGALLGPPEDLGWSRGI